MVPSSLHVAIIMDGNGRWAMSRGLSRAAGHKAGMEAVRRIVAAAPGLAIGTLTLFAFSSDNWQRPLDQVETLMEIFRSYLSSDLDSLVRRGLRVGFIGRRDRLPPHLIAAIEAAETATCRGDVMHLRIAVDYSGREAILRTARRLRAAYQVSHDVFSRLLAEVNNDACHASDVDLLVRTGGEQRLSDALLWESAYAELVFTKRLWPDFSVGDLEAAIEEYNSRERRYGRLPEAAAVSPVSIADRTSRMKRGRPVWERCARNDRPADAPSDQGETDSWNSCPNAHCLLIGHENSFFHRKISFRLIPS